MKHWTGWRRLLRWEVESVAIEELRPKSYHGIEVLDLHVGEPIPTPRAPVRYAVRVTPDLARYLLTFNHPNNRHMRERKARQIAADMTAGRYAFTPESLVFSVTGILQNGQTRLLAVTIFGGGVWMVIDFGWPDEIITAIDRGSARTNQDTMHVSGFVQASHLASTVTKVWQYDRTVGQTRSWSGLDTPSSREALAIVQDEPDRWHGAVTAGMRVYRALDKGLSPTVWGAAHYLIARENGEKADLFLTEIAEGTGAPNTPTRKLADWFRRRPTSITRSGDVREPVEIIIRGFNAWAGGAAFAFVKYPGFALSRVRKA